MSRSMQFVTKGRLKGQLNVLTIGFWAAGFGFACLGSTVALAQEAATAAQAADAVAESSVWSAMLSASIPVQITLLLLLGMSIASWAIVFWKKKQFQAMKSENQKFVSQFSITSLGDMLQKAKNFEHSTYANVFRLSYEDLQKKQLDLKNEGSLGRGMRCINKHIDEELAQLEKHLGFLATTGSTAPFVGLFGTVWGIMGAFQKIATSNMASLAVVAPGISEALVATAIGLAVAIPATVFYNHYLGRVRFAQLELKAFADELIDRLKQTAKSA